MNFTIVGNEIVCHEYPSFKKAFTNHLAAVKEVMDNHDQLELEVLNGENKVNKNEILEYFNNKYINDDFIINTIKQTPDNELVEIYEKDLMRSKEEKEVFENGLTTYRLNYETKEDEIQIVKYMKENNMYCFDDGILNYRIRVGNYCIVGVPEKFLNELQEKFNIKWVDLKREVIGKKDIENLKVGDKVKIYTDGIFGLSVDQGTIYEINESEIIVRKYKSKTKGYIIEVGQYGSIEKISKFSKVA